MKRFIGLVLVMACAFWVGGCNTPGDEEGGPGGEAVDISWTVDYLYDEFTGSDFAGALVDLAGRNILDISKYANVTVNATLYTDAEGTTKATMPSGDNKNLAQFTLLKGSSNWDNNKITKTRDSMNVDGDTVMIINPAEDKGIPTHMLIEVNWKDFTQDGTKVKSIKVNTITFSTSFSLAHIFGNSATIEGNKITFNNASYGDSADGNNWDGTAGVGSAVLCIFPASWGNGDDLANKTFKFNFTIEQHTCTSANGVTEVEHQLNVQAAQNTPEKNLFNGQNPTSSNGNVGQKYITLDSADETGYNTTTGTGTFTIPANDMIAASKANIDGNDGKGPFTLDSVRISNNGTKWDEAGVKTHYRCKSYKLVINSVTIQ